MRVAILGKGGSGKTSISSSLVRSFKNKFENVLAVDADLNAHLGEYIGFSEKPISLGDHYHGIAEYLFGDREVNKYPNIGTIPPTLESNFVSISKTDPLLSKFANNHENVFHISSGTYVDKDLGDSCFHAKLNSLELLMHHLLDKKGDLVVIDAAAGIDSVATSMYLIPDITFFVIEPTKKSISVYKDYLRVLKKKIEKYNLVIIPILNKIEDKEDIDFIRSEIDSSEDPIIFRFSKNLIRFEQGVESYINEFIEEHQIEFDKILNLIKSSSRDYDIYLQALRDTFNDECTSWANETYNANFSPLVDPDFTYQSVIEKDV